MRTIKYNLLDIYEWISGNFLFCFNQHGGRRSRTYIYKRALAYISLNVAYNEINCGKFRYACIIENKSLHNEKISCDHTRLSQTIFSKSNFYLLLVEKEKVDRSKR